MLQKKVVSSDEVDTTGREPKRQAHLLLSLLSLLSATSHHLQGDPRTYLARFGHTTRSNRRPYADDPPIPSLRSLLPFRSPFQRPRPSTLTRLPLSTTSTRSRLPSLSSRRSRSRSRFVYRLLLPSPISSDLREQAALLFSRLTCPFVFHSATTDRRTRAGFLRPGLQGRGGQEGPGEDRGRFKEGALPPPSLLSSSWGSTSLLCSLLYVRHNEPFLTQLLSLSCSLPQSSPSIISVPTILSFIHLHSLVFKSQGLLPDAETPKVVKNLSSQEAAAIGKTWHALVVEKEVGIAEKLAEGKDEEVLEGVSCESSSSSAAAL